MSTTRQGIARERRDPHKRREGQVCYLRRQQQNKTSHASAQIVVLIAARCRSSLVRGLTGPRGCRSEVGVEFASLPQGRYSAGIDMPQTLDAPAKQNGSIVHKARSLAAHTFRRLSGTRRTKSEPRNLVPLLIQVLAGFSKVDGRILEEEIDSSLGFLRYDYPA